MYRKSATLGASIQIWRGDAGQKKDCRTRDFAFVVDCNTPAEKLTGTAMASDGRITDVVIFDAFELPDGKKSIAFTITITPTENMSDDDLQKIQDAVITNVERKCNAQIRDK